MNLRKNYKNLATSIILNAKKEYEESKSIRVDLDIESYVMSRDFEQHCDLAEVDVKKMREEILSLKKDRKKDRKISSKVLSNLLGLNKEEIENSNGAKGYKSRYFFDYETAKEIIKELGIEI